MHQQLFDFMSRYVTLTREEEQAIVELDIFKTVKKGTVLLEEGQKSQKGYFVLKGCIRVYYVIEGEEKTTAFYTELQGLTPSCVPSGQASEYFVATTEDCILLIADSSMETEMFARFPKFETLCRILSEELLMQQQMDFNDYKTSSPEQRYLALMEKRPDLIQRVPQHQLASYLGVKPQSLSRLKARIQKKSRAQ